MPPGAGMFYFLGVLLIELPIAAVRTILRLLFFVLRRVFAVFRLRQFWRAVPLDRKCQFRATVGAFVLVVLGGGILCDAIPAPIGRKFGPTAAWPGSRCFLCWWACSAPAGAWIRWRFSGGARSLSRAARCSFTSGCEE